MPGHDSQVRKAARVTAVMAATAASEGSAELRPACPDRPLGGFREYCAMSQYSVSRQI